MKRSINIAAGAGLALLLAAPLASAQDEQPTYQPAPGPVTGERREIRPNRPLLITGGAIVAASYVPAVIVAATSDRDGDKWLYAPVVGPWGDLIDREGCGPNGCGAEAVYKTLLIGAGVAHLVGVGAIIASFVVPETKTEMTAKKEPPKPEVHVAPTQIGRNGYGLGVSGRF